MAQTRVVVHNEVRSKLTVGTYVLYFQRGTWVHTEEDKSQWTEDGYRFMWRNAAGNMLPHRAQARLPSLYVIKDLLEQAEAAGWGNFDANNVDALFESAWAHFDATAATV